MQQQQHITQKDVRGNKYTMVSSAAIILTAWCTLTQPAFAFNLPARNQSARANTMALSSTATASSATNENTSKSYLYIPSERDEQYQGNIASYLLDLDEEGATLDFCGGQYINKLCSSYASICIVLQIFHSLKLSASYIMLCSSYASICFVVQIFHSHTLFPAFFFAL